MNLLLVVLFTCTPCHFFANQNSEKSQVILLTIIHDNELLVRRGYFLKILSRRQMFSKHLNYLILRRNLDRRNVDDDEYNDTDSNR